MSLKQENELLKQMIESQASRIGEQETTIKELRSVIDELRQVRANLEETIAEFRRQFFGIKSEKTGTQEPDSGEMKKTAPKVTVKEHVRARKPKSTKEERFADLPVKEEVYDVPENERRCDWCGSGMETISREYVRDEIRITPAKVERIRLFREVLLCPQCRKDHDGTFKKAPVPEALIPHSPASASAVAHIVFSRVFLGLPYYRLEAAFRQPGAGISRETFAKWCIHAAERFFTPVYDLMHQELIMRDVIHADETVCQVLREEGKEAHTNSYMWIYASGSDSLPKIILYEYQPGRGGCHPKKFLKGFQGLLQCDGYQGYNAVERVILACCLAHCRRKFFEAVPAVRKKGLKLLDINSPEELREPEIPTEDLDKYIPAEIGVAYCNKLFYLERSFKKLSPEERKKQREQKEVPVWDSFWKWLGSLDTAKGSKFEKAVNYAQNHKETLCTYLQDGRCEISNNAVERKAKSYAIGRKNSLFHTSVAGAKASAVMYSLVETAKENGLNVFQYIYTLLLYMPGYKNEPAGIKQLLPWSDFIKEHCSGLIDIENMTVNQHPELPLG